MTTKISMTPRNGREWERSHRMVSESEWFLIYVYLNDGQAINHSSIPFDQHWFNRLLYLFPLVVWGPFAQYCILIYMFVVCLFACVFTWARECACMCVRGTGRWRGMSMTLHNLSLYGTGSNIYRVLCQISQSLPKSDVSKQWNSLDVL